ncbi:hypothetical protein ATO12_12285 [Aquimarina atlantica]|uniref:DUF4015 domain-containing protein n=1 Tax=Aquimarina atlantica TaxID=1317122 RepID=A0A023BWY2_9FLAO|nr:hypothetical protein [Aquimarina atlantica]EZH74541.1 hypothetical protein ATO12_12285 [Aquimarina atlantica]
MKKLFSILSIVFVLVACKNKAETEKDVITKNKIPVFAWAHLPENASDDELRKQFQELKNKGIDGLMYSAGHDPLTYKRVGKIIKETGMEFHAWIPTMIQNSNPKLKPEWYAINRNGESAYDKPAYVSHYQFLCPNKDEVYDFLKNLYSSVADVDEVDGIHLDYIRFPDVILAKGLWEKYDLVMDKEYPQFDYCYCDKCVHDFKSLSGIDIKAVEDPSQIEEWKQFRYDLITKMVNRLADVVHDKNKVINAAVFPGPNSIAKKLVRQEWNKWNLDAFFPMNYNDFYLEDTKWIGELTKEEVTAVNNKKPVYSGLFICPKPKNKANEADPENHGLLPEELAAAISESIQNGATGICLFTPNRMTDTHWEVLQKTISTDFTK